MFVLIALGILALVLGIARGIYRIVMLEKKAIGGFSVAALLLGALSLLGGMTLYTQDVGEAVVIKSWTGNVTGSTSTAGLHVKAPWTNTIKYDVRNNVVTYVGDGTEGDHSGGSATGAQITVQDRDGTSADVDIVVRYSIDPAAVEGIYAEYSTQENFVTRVITNDVRSVVRDAPARYTAIDFLNKRSQVSQEIRNELENRWEGAGVTVEEVQLQEIRYGASVRERFDAAQESRIAISQAEADLETARVNADKAAAEAKGRAEALLIEAEAQSEANNKLNASLTESVLRQRYIDAIGKSSTVYVVPEGSQPLVQKQNAK